MTPLTIDDELARLDVEFPRLVDSQLATLYEQAQKQQRRFAMFAESAKREAGAEFRYVGRSRHRTTTMTLAEAEAILAKDVLHFADDTYGYAFVRRGHSGMSYTIGSIRHTVAGLAECREALAVINAEMQALEEQYTGWSRFFLVTSSQGHIHSSMNCSTCRITTTYGWLPELSGATEADAVRELGPALCSVCFPSAPVEWTQTKLTKKQAEAVAS